jgi:hypothetical protein
MKTYLKENYPTVKQRAQNTLDDFDNHKSDLRFHLDRLTIVIGILVESINRFLYHALHCRINSEYRISIGTRCGRDR